MIVSISQETWANQMSWSSGVLLIAYSHFTDTNPEHWINVCLLFEYTKCYFIYKMTNIIFFNLYASLTIAELDSTLIIFKYKVTFGDNIN